MTTFPFEIMDVYSFIILAITQKLWRALVGYSHVMYAFVCGNDVQNRELTTRCEVIGIFAEVAQQQ